MWSQALRARLRMYQASTVLRLHQLQIRFAQWRLQHGLKLVTVVLLATAGIAIIVLPSLQELAGTYFQVPENLATLRSLLTGTGAALIGAATIGFSLVVFAMQINVERMPHGLFRQLSSDRRLLCSFLGSFLLALLIAGMSLLPNGTWAIPVIIAAVWSVAAIILLFIYAYRRALQIINPIEQLSIMTGVVCHDLENWARLADLVVIVGRGVSQPDALGEGEGAAVKANLNEPKAMFFLVNNGWDSAAKQALHYAMSYTKRFAEQGDYQVTDSAFRKILDINIAYCQAKRGTFIAASPFLDLPGTTDGFINLTLEHLRQAMQSALTHSDERLAQSTLRTLGALFGVYLQIEYPGLNPTKHHAMIAAGYLASSVETVARHDLPDVMMEGIRLMGRGARVALDHTAPTEIIILVQKIGTLSYVGALKNSHKPVTLVAFEQLSLITYDLLMKGEHDVQFAAEELRSTVTAAAKIFLQTADTPLGSAHSSTLGPYFSVTQVTSLLGKLQFLANQLLAAPEDDEAAGQIIDNLETWADQIYASQKELLLLAVEKRSHFTFDAINWIIHISEVLNTVSNAPACSEHTAEELRKHARWLVLTLSWLPDDRESVTFAETFSVTEGLFRAAVNGYQRDCLEFYEDCQNLLFGWAMKGGNHENSWGILENAIKGLAVLVLEEGTAGASTALKRRLQERLPREGAPPEGARARAAAELTRTANLMGQPRGFRAIDQALAQLDHARSRALLLEIAAILAPGEV